MLVMTLICFMVDRDPYNGLLYYPYNWVVFHSLYTLHNQVPFSLLMFYGVVFQNLSQKNGSGDSSWCASRRVGENSSLKSSIFEAKTKTGQMVSVKNTPAN